MIKFITAEDLLTVRRDVLRPGKTLDQSRFPGDEADETFHLGYYVQDELACIASFYPKSYGEFSGAGYQFRGMATVPKYRRQGLGNQLLNFAIVYLRGQNAAYLWCNARKSALQFYLDMGFEVISPEFNVPEIGPHHVLYVKIK